VNEDLSEIGIDTPVPLLVRVGEGASRRDGAKAHVVEPLGHGPQGRLHVPEALAEGKLRKGQREEMVPAGEATDSCIAIVALHTPLELPVRRVGHHLGEERFPLIHRPLRSVSSRQSGT
jgi:hypothetical protein